MSVASLVEAGFQWDERQDFPILPSTAAELYAEVAPYLAYLETIGDLMNGGPSIVSNPKFKLFEHRSGFVEQYFRVNDAAPSAWATGAGGETITVPIDTLTGFTDDASIGDFLLGWSGEVVTAIDGTGTRKGKVFVKTVNAGANSVVLEAIGNPYQVDNLVDNLADDDYIWLEKPARATGSNAGEAYSDELGDVWNTCEFTSVPVEVDGDLLYAYLHGTGMQRNEAGGELMRLNREMEKTWMMSRNRKLLHGMSRGGTGMGVGDSMVTSSTLDGKKLRFTDGGVVILRKYGSTSGDKQNIFTFDASNPGTSTTLSEWLQMDEKVAQYGEPTIVPERVGFCGRGFLRLLTQVFLNSSFAATGQFRIDESRNRSQVFNFNVRRIEFPNIDLVLKVDPSFNGPNRYLCFVPHPDHVGKKQFGPEPMFKQNIKVEDDYHGQKNVFNADEGNAMTLQEASFLIELTP